VDVPRCPAHFLLVKKSLLGGFLPDSKIIAPMFNHPQIPGQYPGPRTF
jgi:hypothetical protein